jgi:hypothetical protein
MANMTSEKYYERYGGMPIPPMKQNMEVYEAGAISIGVEFRVLNNAVVRALGLGEIAASNAYPELDDHGVSLHVFVHTSEGNHERLRFDCFQNDPHYHYLSLPNKTQDVIHLDCTVIGDPVAWALTMLRTRLVPMLLRADIDDAGLIVDHTAVEQILPKVTEAAFRARFSTDRKRIEQAALQRGQVEWDTSPDRSWEEHSQL